MQVGLPVTRTPSWWWCTRRVSPDCSGLTRVHANVPNGSMCSACERLMHMYYCSKDKKDGVRFAHIRRIQAKHGGPTRGKGGRIAGGGSVRKCGFEGCTRPVHRSMEFGVMVEHRCLCLYHFQHGEDLQAGG